MDTAQDEIQIEDDDAIVDHECDKSEHFIDTVHTPENNESHEDLTTKNEDQVNRSSNSIEDLEAQIVFLRDIVVTVGKKLAESNKVETPLILPEFLDKITTQSTIENLAGMIESLNLHIAAQASEIADLKNYSSSHKCSTCLKHCIDNSNSSNTEDCDVKESPMMFVPTSSVLGQWEEVNEWHPVPTYGLESPVITHLLNTWTTDETKVTLTLTWLKF